MGRIYERAGLLERAAACYRRAADVHSVEVRGGSSLSAWPALPARPPVRRGGAPSGARSSRSPSTRSARRNATLVALRQFAVEALAIHHEHRERDLKTARELALFALNERRGEGRDDRRAEGYCATGWRGSRGSSTRQERRPSSSAGVSEAPTRPAPGAERLNCRRLGRCRLLLGLRGRLAALGGLRAEPLREPLDSTFGIDQLLPAGEERVAVVADLEVELLLGRAGAARSRRTRSGRRPRDTWGGSLPSLLAPSGLREKVIIPNPAASSL